LGRSNELAHSAIRFSLGRFNTDQEIEYAIKEIIDTVSVIKEKSPQQQLMNA
jgi:cysteine desulfurase